MTRVHGSIENGYIECINPKYRKYRVRWDFAPYFNEEGEEQGVTYYEHEFTHQPSMEEIKYVVLAGYNAAIDAEIISGFVWKGMEVWLSSENQFNYKAAYDLAVQTNCMNLPVTFKFGTTENPAYYTFETLDDLTDFYTQAMGYINQRLAEGWAKKDAIDWSVYQL